MPVMESLEIRILNPKVKKLLKDLAELKLISITSRAKQNKSFQELVERLRGKASDAPTMQAIAKEVEAVRKSRHER